MNIIDLTIFFIYMCAVFLVGVYFYRKNKSKEDYYVGGRNIGPWHIGMSVVATDVGGGFSIGLAGLGYLIGLSGSWLLFTGLVGAWLAAVFIVPKLKKLDKKESMLTYPDFLRYKYGKAVAFVAALISGLGYMGFTGGQILAGAKLSAATLFYDIPFDMDPMHFSLIIIAGVILLYTAMGGLKAVIYTDTIQWILLLSGLAFIAVPFTIIEAGGWDGLRAALPDEFFTLTNVTAVDIINWMITIIPIWLIALTLYQRMYAARNEKEAKKAWFIAGVFEYPIMAFIGVFLGMCSSIFFPSIDSEQGLPMLLKEILPIGVKGVVISAYFSAIMSTADSCLIASSGNFVNDIIQQLYKKNLSKKAVIRLSQIATLLIGIVTLLIAVSFESVLEIILHAYSFMVAGLTVPTLAAYFKKKLYPLPAMLSMISGGGLTLALIFTRPELPYGLHPTLWGILLSVVFFYITEWFVKRINLPDYSSHSNE